MPATDNFSGRSSGLSSAAENGFAVTPNDNADLAFVTRALYVGTAGDLKVTLKGMTDGTSVTLASVAVGVLPVRVKRVLATGTTADDIVGLY